MDPKTACDLESESALQPVHELRRRLDVVRQDKHVLRLKRPVRSEQMTDPLDHDRCLSSARAGKNHQRSITPFDRGRLFSCQFKRAFGDCTLR